MEIETKTALAQGDIKGKLTPIDLGGTLRVAGDPVLDWERGGCSYHIYAALFSPDCGPALKKPERVFIMCRDLRPRPGSPPPGTQEQLLPVVDGVAEMMGSENIVFGKKITYQSRQLTDEMGIDGRAPSIAECQLRFEVADRPHLPWESTTPEGLQRHTLCPVRFPGEAEPTAWLRETAVLGSDLEGAIVLKKALCSFHDGIIDIMVNSHIGETFRALEQEQ